jgi:hypothetical protein
VAGTILAVAAALSGGPMRGVAMAQPTAGCEEVSGRDPGITPKRGSYKMLVIPVVTSSHDFDLADNLVNAFDKQRPHLAEDIIPRYQMMHAYWTEATYGIVDINADVLPRYYRMPRNKNEYFNPEFKAVFVASRPGLTFPLTVPPGDLRLRMHIHKSDDTPLTVSFDAASPPFADLSALRGFIKTQLAEDAGDKLAVKASQEHSQLRLEVDPGRVRAGTRLTVEPSSDAAVVSALGLTSYRVSGALVTSDRATFPMAVGPRSHLTLTIVYADGGTRAFTWDVPAGQFASAAELARALSNGVPDAVVTATPGGELQFNLTSRSGRPIADIETSANNTALLRSLGLDARISAGVVTFDKRNTVRGDRMKIICEAVGSYILSELTQRAPGTPDGIPTVPVTSENAEALNRVFKEKIDTYKSIAVIFLDAEKKRGGASGGKAKVVLTNGNYSFRHKISADLQIVLIDSTPGTIMHETGHNIGFPDLYNNKKAQYLPGLVYPQSWDIMATSKAENHPSAWSKSVDTDWVQVAGGTVAVFPLPADGIPETRRYVLTPLERSPASYDAALADQSDRTKAKVIRIPIGRGTLPDEHFLLIENRQLGPQFSQRLPEGGGLLITDALTRKLFASMGPATRNYAHPLTDQKLVDGNARPVVNRSPDPDIDLNKTFPAYPGIGVDIVGEIAGPDGAKSLLVDVTRQRADFLELGMRQSSNQAFESPDIWLENGDKVQSDLSPMPLPGNGEALRWAEDYDEEANDGKPLNWVRVRVSNNGTVDAEEVEVKARVTDGCEADLAQGFELPTHEKKIVAAGGSTIFDFRWNPASKREVCLTAQIARWKARAGEVDFANNLARESIGEVEIASAGPWPTWSLQFNVANFIDEDIDVVLQAHGVPPGLTVRFDEKTFELPARSSMRRNAVIRVDQAFYPAPAPDGRGSLRWLSAAGEDAGGQPTAIRPVKPSEARIDMVASRILPDHGEVTIGGMSYVVRLTRAATLDVEVTSPGPRQIRVSGRTSPPAGNQDLDVMVRYPSGRIDWIKVATGADGSFQRAIGAADSGTAMVSLRPRGRGDFSIAASGTRMIDITGAR